MNWKATENPYGTGFHVTDEIGRRVADVCERDAGITHEEATHRANKIAAAPELLASLEAVLGAYVPPFNDEPVYVAALAAIRKARGE